MVTFNGPRGRGWLVGILVAATGGCYAEEPNYFERLEDPLDSSIAGADEIRLLIGQDVDSVAEYAETVGPVVGASGYSSIHRLEGLTRRADAGGGPMHLSAMAQDYPGAPLALGLYMVNALDSIVSGDRDTEIDELAGVLGAYDTTVLLRIGYEFDGSWNGYEPEPYIDAYRRIVDRFRDAGVENVEYVWQSAGSCGGGSKSRDQAQWYPGDEYVDWVSTSLFSSGQTSCVRGPGRMVRLAREYRKPLLIAESTPQGYDLEDLTFSWDGTERDAVTADEIWTGWFEPFFDFIDENDDVVRGVVYINADWELASLWADPYDNGYWGDSRVQANEEITRRWLDVVDDERWIAR